MGGLGSLSDRTRNSRRDEDSLAALGVPVPGTALMNLFTNEIIYSPPETET
jgi:hypothetical protein